jgi:GNAT superfamily N-acetyltransferase
VTDEEVGEVLVCVRGRLTDVPEMALPDGFTIRDLDGDDPAEVARWLVVVNAAFGRTWIQENHRLAMVDNPVVEVDRTFLVERDGEPVGTASIGRYRRNPEVGIGHYLSVHPSAQRHGLAVALCSHRYRAMAQTDLVVGEAQTHLHRIGSLRAHFRCGFEPKTTIDPWNSLTPPSGPLREEADRRLEEAFAAWRDGR